MKRRPMVLVSALVDESWTEFAEHSLYVEAFDLGRMVFNVEGHWRCHSRCYWL
jgi:hypothetical protein